MATSLLSVSRVRYGMSQNFRLSAAGDDLVIQLGTDQPVPDVNPDILADSQLEPWVAVTRRTSNNTNVNVRGSYVNEPDITDAAQWASIEGFGTLNAANPSRDGPIPGRPIAIWITANQPIDVCVSTLSEAPWSDS